MRTTVTLPDPLFRQAKQLSEGGSFSEFVRQAISERVARVRRETMARDMDAGYQSEASEPSLDPEWTDLETEGW